MATASRQLSCSVIEIARKMLCLHSLGNIGISLFCHHAAAVGLSVKEVAGEFAKFIGETSKANERLAAAHHFFIYLHRTCPQDLLFTDTKLIDSFLINSFRVLYRSQRSLDEIVCIIFKIGE